MPGLLRGVARTAVVMRHRHRGVQPCVPPPERPVGAAGGRTAGGRSPPAAAPPAAAAPLADDMTAKIEQLKQLSTLKEQGVLTEEEFAEQKRRLLG